MEPSFAQARNATTNRVFLRSYCVQRIACYPGWAYAVRDTLYDSIQRDLIQLQLAAHTLHLSLHLRNPARSEQRVHAVVRMHVLTDADLVRFRQLLNTRCDVHRLTEVVEAFVERNGDGMPGVQADLQDQLLRSSAVEG